jgi:biotin transporter BioY
MILISLLIYIIGFFITHWVVGPTHYINGKGIPNDNAQRAIALLWFITAPIFITSLLVFIVRQVSCKDLLDN